jgi:hypothetical protein
MHVLILILAVIGLLALVLLAMTALSDSTPKAAAPPPDDPAAPYREGLHAAVRMQRVAQDLEQQLYTEAARQLGEEGEPVSGRDTPAPGQSAGEV